MNVQLSRANKPEWQQDGTNGQV
ncbi:protein of unknown function [Paraburkholderia dioscoreae]|uniref:Uncharacterized protein n=1 Tax=Paraburkholderia dioscoreae TaxID=2604047 RepID=A0A5Q4ZDF7_9BURK|nr:protein of unknown function [Paraburkholderia dioscoreae]